MQVVWQILKSSLNFMLTEKPRLSHVNFASVLVLFACIVYVDFLNDKWTMSSVICLLSPVSFLLPKTTWLPRLSLGTFASTSLLAVSMFFCMSCQFILAKCNGMHVFWTWAPFFWTCTCFLDLTIIFFGPRVTKNVGDLLVCFLDPVGIFFFGPACICAGPSFFFRQPN